MAAGYFVVFHGCSRSDWLMRILRRRVVELKHEVGGFLF